MNIHQDSIFNYSFVNEWDYQLKFSNDEQQLYDALKCTSLKNMYGNELAEQTYIRKMFEIRCNQELSQFNIFFSDSATTFINAIFKKHYSKNTLVITSENEHESVKKNFLKFKHLCFSNKQIQSFDMSMLDELDFSSIDQIIVYFASVQITTGYFVPQHFIEQLISRLRTKCNNIISILDDVQAMFLYYRAYDTFDYIVSTAHALMRGFDAGILLVNRHHDYSFILQFMRYIDIDKYFDALDVFLARKSKLFQFNHMMTQAFSLSIFRNYCHILHSVPSYFSIDVTSLQFIKKYKTKLDAAEFKIEYDENAESLSPTVLRIRGQQFLDNNHKLVDSMKLLDVIVSQEI